MTQTQLDKVIYTAKVHTPGGRDGGASQSNDGRLNIHHSVPGAPGTGTNPEQFLVAGWSACFEGAMGLAARKTKVRLPADMATGARSCPGHHRRHASNMPVFQGDSEQH